jgi:signal transduction histidine kinase
VIERPGRRARRALAVAGVLGAVAVGCAAAAAWVLGTAPSLLAVVVAVAVTVLAGMLAGSWAAARRAGATALVVGAAVAALGLTVLLAALVVSLVFGRSPTRAEAGLVLPALTGVAVAALLAWPLGARAVRTARAVLHGARRSPDELLADFAERAGRGASIDEPLRELAESMRRDWRLSTVEIWAGDGATLTRAATVPAAAGPAPRELAGEELTVLLRAGVAGPGWLEMWLPRLLDGRAGRQVRLAPAVHGDQVLALAIIEREADADPFGGAEERALAEVARRLAVMVRNRALDDALQATLADLRRSNAELRASRARLVATADAERQRIERDLHDGAQQHLVALAVGLRLVRDGLADGGTDAGTAELLDELDRGVREAVDELRTLAQGIYPPLLRDAGLAEALRAVAKRSPLTVTVHADGLGRYPEEVEAAVYFCCLEALQNAAKHAPGATAAVELAADAERLRFTVADSGTPAAASFTPGTGMQNMADRVGALGGTVTWHAEPGTGTTVTGLAPLNGRA